VTELEKLQDEVEKTVDILQNQLGELSENIESNKQ
jgi:hypothetical protein